MVDCDFSGSQVRHAMKPVQQLDLSGLHVLDGGMATELERRGCDLAGPLWSAHVLESSPETIAAVHRDYLEAGADCLLTASYQVSAEGFQQMGRDPRMRPAAAMRCAPPWPSPKRPGASTRPLTRAGSGSQLRSDPTARCCTTERSITAITIWAFDDLVGFHSRRIAVLAETNADFLVFETIPSLEEARAIASRARAHPGVPACLSFTCRDERTFPMESELPACADCLTGKPR